MALHINNKNDWNEMFDKFATVPLEKNKPNADLKKEDSTDEKTRTDKKNKQ
ncbi:SPJ_0845 family protein [Lacticaseibacillus baoqingensis]|uniref:SPJ_0845 family protein n=1 Tax=Lacticaseibacillus baoqingensis TaxID=2486013 RepID=A0ABW4EBC2_9LACO|nr:SPJ_0845 family protein [Lacticaseibacillus baoqingensis]